MHIHILGICGTFMGSLALIARKLGHQVTGSDQNVYPPMSTQLTDAGIEIMPGYLASHLQPAPDLVIVGNALKRGIDAVEYMLNQRLPYTSGPQFLADQVLKNRHVLAVAGTHGKTTTTTMLSWVLHEAGIDTGFLIGGVPLAGADSVFKQSAYLGKDYFVIEADEYDSAFFDKRSKFVHYRPTTAILNNLEFDHADIFADLSDIQRQFHHMVRMIPANGQIIMPAHTPSLEQVIDMGAWTPVVRTQVADDQSTGASGEMQSCWQAKLIKQDGSQFQISYNSNERDHHVTVDWNMTGLHNVYNGLAAVAAAHHVGVSPDVATKALSNFSGIKRRMELVGQVGGVSVFDDFAHHPTAIATTLDGARKTFGSSKIWAVIEPRSNTMQLGSHQDHLVSATKNADQVIWFQPRGIEWQIKPVVEDISNHQVFVDTQAIVEWLCRQVGDDDVIIIMSNGGFEGIHGRLFNALSGRG